MIKIIGNGLFVEGELVQFDPGTNDMYLKFRGGQTLEIPNPPTSILQTMRAIGLEKLRNCVIDLNKMSIELVDATKSQTGGGQKDKNQLPGGTFVA